MVQQSESLDQQLSDEAGAVMGRQQVRLEVVASVSRHNDPRDEMDDAQWDELRERVEALAEEYSSLGAVIV